MLSFLNKNSDKSSVGAVPAWHPNFRNFERLPDIKVVRTSFFVNGVAILTVTTLALYLIYREAELSSLRSDSTAAQQVINANKSISDQSIATFKKFQEQERKIHDLQQFMAVAKITLSEFLLELGSSLPPAVALNNIEYRPTGVTLRGRIKASSEEGAGMADSYVRVLANNAYFSNISESITLTSISRDPVTGEVVIQIDLNFRAVSKSISQGKK